MFWIARDSASIAWNIGTVCPRRCSPTGRFRTTQPITTMPTSNGVSAKRAGCGAKCRTRLWRNTITELVELDHARAHADDLRGEPRCHALAPRRVARGLHFTGTHELFEPDPRLHGSYHFDWTTGDEVAWRKNFQRWMEFVNDYKNAGVALPLGRMQALSTRCLVSTTSASWRCYRKPDSIHWR